MQRLSDLWLTLCLAFFVCMAAGSILLDIITGTTTDAAIFLSILGLPAIGSGIFGIYLKERGC